MEKVKLIAGLSLSALVGILTIPFLTRHLNPLDLGYVFKLFLIYGLFGVLDALKPLVVRYASIYYSKYGELAVFDLVKPSLFAAFPFSLVFSLFVFFLLGVEFAALNVATIFFSAFLFVIMSSLWGMVDALGKVGSAYLIRSIGSTILYLLLVLMVLLDIEAKYFSIALVAPIIFCCISYLYLLYPFICTKRRVGSCFFNMELCRSCLDLAVFNLFRLGVDFFDRIIVSKYLGQVSFGTYSAMNELVSKGNIVSQHGTNYSYPKLCQYANIKHKREDHYVFWRRRFSLFSSIIFPFVFVAAYFSDRIVLFYFGESFSNHNKLFVIFLIGSVLSHFVFFSRLYYRSLGEFRLENLITVIMLIVSIILFHYLIESYGLVGVGLAFILIKFVGFILLMLISFHRYRDYLVVLGSSFMLLSMMFLYFELHSLGFIFFLLSFTIQIIILKQVSYSSSEKNKFRSENKVV